MKVRIISIVSIAVLVVLVIWWFTPSIGLDVRRNGDSSVRDATLIATVTDHLKSNLAGEEVRFYSNGVEIAKAYTDNNGAATAHTQLNPGTYTLSAAFVTGGSTKQSNSVELKVSDNLLDRIASQPLLGTNLSTVGLVALVLVILVVVTFLAFSLLQSRSSQVSAENRAGAAERQLALTNVRHEEALQRIVAKQLDVIERTQQTGLENSNLIAARIIEIMMRYFMLMMKMQENSATQANYQLYQAMLSEIRSLGIAAGAAGTMARLARQSEFPEIETAKLIGSKEE